MSESKKISELDITNTLYDGCCFPIVQNDETKRVLFSTIKNELKTEFSIQDGHLYADGEDLGFIEGTDGLSAYQIACQRGFVGTEESWLASLKGEKGDVGATGIQGEKGEQGKQGIQGEKGDTFTFTDLTSEQVAELKSDISTYIKRDNYTVQLNVNDTIITIPDSNYRNDVDILDIYINGVHLQESKDYTRTNTGVTLNDGVETDCVAEITITRSVSITTEDYDKLKGNDGISPTVDSALSTTSTNTLQNKVITSELNKKLKAESTNMTSLGFTKNQDVNLIDFANAVISKYGSNGILNIGYNNSYQAYITDGTNKVCVNGGYFIFATNRTNSVSTWTSFEASYFTPIDKKGIIYKICLLIEGNVETPTIQEIYTFSNDKIQNSKITTLETTINELKTLLSSYSTGVMPIGACYMQYPNETAPSDLFGGTWVKQGDYPDNNFIIWKREA